jgi:hypothetical protein
MLRAGICDLGTCDLEIGGVACPAGQGCWRPVRTAQGRLPPPRREGIRLGRARRLPPGARSAAGGRLAARSARRAADLQRYRPVGDEMPHLRPAVWRVSAGRCRAFRPGKPRRFRPGRRGVSAPGATAFPSRGAAGFCPGCRGFPARDATTFPAWFPRGFRPDGAQPAARSRAAIPPAAPGRRLLPDRRLLPGREIHFPDEPHAAEWIQ